MGLKEYRRKRDFERTPEPAGRTRPARAPAKPGTKAAAKPSFVVQKHAARRMHYDFRLELDGVLKSWAVPKGPSLDPATKRLAVHVEDHPLEYGDFEGVIPAGEYGGGTVMVWDRGWWEPYGDADAGYAKGDFKFILHGAKLHGRWVLVRMKGRRRDERDKGDNWLLIKERDEAAQPGDGDTIVERETRSAATGREMDAIARDADRVWHSNRDAPVEAKTGAAKPVVAKPRKPALDVSGVAGARPARAPPTLAPQLAQTAANAPPGDDWLHEIKFDGYRMLAHVKRGTVRLTSRNALDWTDKFPELAEALAALGVDEALLDGEIVHLTEHGVSSFSALQADLSEGTTAGLVYMAFDLLFLDGFDLTAARLEDRKAALRELLDGGVPPTIRYSDHHAGQGPEFFTAACGLGLEGIVSKRRDAPYRAGRSPAWLKIKSLEREDLVVVGFTDPEGERTGFGALLVGYHTPKGKLAKGKLVYAGRVGTGYTDKVLQALRARLGTLEQKRATVALPDGLSARGTHWVKPELVVEVGFSEWTRDGILRAASFVGLREDKAPAEVVLEPAAAGRTPRPAPAVALTPVARDGAAMVGGVRVTHAERVVYPDLGITKLAVAEYYAAVADAMLPHVARRPLSLVRCPEGIAGERFYQKHLTAGMPDAIKEIQVPTKDGSEPYVMIEDARGLVALAQMGVLEIHPWGSTVDRLEQPDRLIFDLDPDEGLAWERVVAAALEVRATLDKLGLVSFAKTTGGKGLHVVVPIKPALDWDAAKELCRALVLKLVDAAPQSYTASMAKPARRGRIFIDYLRNGRGATAVGAYSTRARPGATVSAPLTWAEVESFIRSDQFTIRTLPRRLHAGAEPWADFAATKQAISAAACRKLGV
jgi:bifunctional non-homologous end joining protein LigD